APATNTNVDEVPARDDVNRVVFRDQFADGGELTVVKDDQAQISFSVSAPIGSAAETLLKTARGVSSLADVYAALHEGKSPVPTGLAGLWAELEATPAKALPVVPAPKLAPGVTYGPLSAAGDLAKSQSAFMSNYCKTFVAGAIVFRPGTAPNNWCWWD